MAKRTPKMERLKQAQDAFSKWRRKRGKHWGPIPEPLWQVAVSLLDEVTPNRVARALRLSSSSLMEKAREIGVPERITREKSEENEKKPTFLKTCVAEIVNIQQTPVNRYSGITIRRPDGAEMIFHEPTFDSNGLTHLVTAFLGGR